MMEKKTLLYIFIITLVGGLLYWYNFDPKPDLNGDNANYFMLGKALKTGAGYVNITAPDLRPNNHFPPGYPAIIATAFLIFPDTFITVKLLNGLFFIVACLLVFWLVKNITGNAKLSLLFALIVAFNAHLLKYSSMMMTEIPFLFLSLSSLYFFLKTPQTNALKSKEFWFSLVLLVVAYYVRSLAVALFGAYCLVFLFSKRWKELGAAIALVVGAIVPWMVRSQQLGGNSYVKQLLRVNPYRPEMGQAGISDFAARFFNNLERYITLEIPSGILPFLEVDYSKSANFAYWILGLLLVGVIAFGLYKIPKYKLLLSAYIGATLFILMLWPDVWKGIRFLLPLVPVLLVAMAVALQHFLEYLQKKTTVQINILYLLPVVLVFWTSIKKNHQMAAAPMTPNWSNYFATAQWVKNNLPSEVTVACRKPTLFYLESNSKTTNYKYTKDAEELLNHLKRKNVDYVVLDQLGYSSTYQYLLPAIQANRDKFVLQVQFKNPDTYLFKFMP